jgi:hypothetical protein
MAARALSVGDLMRNVGLLLFSLTIAGCAAHPVAVIAPKPEPVYDDAVAAALVYDPPAIQYGPLINTDRNGRATSAFAGFDEPITTFYYLYVDDRQGGYGIDGLHGGNGWGHSLDRYERQAITQRSGVSYR